MKTRLASLAVACTTFALLQTASAEDGKTYPGSNCHPLDQSSAATLSLGFNYIENTSTQYSALVICPIVKDEVFSLTGVNYINIRYDKPSTTGFYCGWYSKSSTGASGYTSSSWDFSAAGNAKSMTLTNTNSYSGGTYQLYCILPPKANNKTAKLHSYRIDEN